MDTWVNEGNIEPNKNRCAVCLTKYSMTKKFLPIRVIFKRNLWIMLSFLAQLILPMGMYVAMYVQGTLARLNGVFIALHLGSLLALFVIFAIQVFSTVRIHDRRVNSLHSI
jgi:hypothetical protein